MAKRLRVILHDPEYREIRRMARDICYVAQIAQYGYNSHEKWGPAVRSVNVAELKDKLSKYIGFAKDGEEVVIRDRNLPVAKLVPFSARSADEQELILVAAGRLRLPKGRLNIKKLVKIPTGKVTANRAIEAVLADRNAEP